MSVEEQARKILDRLDNLYPDHTALHWSNGIELLVAVVLSAQCTDERVNQVTVSLFREYPTAADYAHADPARFETEIKPTGFFRNKAKNIIGACSIIDKEYGGQVPKTMDKMVSLPGIGRKSAAIILAEVYGLNAGIPVDTHVKRLTKRLGLTDSTNPEKIEAELMPEIPQDDWYKFSTELIYHGRAICTARQPKCGECVLNDICPSAFKF
jgi:endonuclease-3